MMASLPFAIPILDKKEVTSTQKCVGMSMMFVLFGGLYLFTQVILFQSIHFDGLRPLTFIECIYFMSQIITTVGYGDITPAKTRGQVFVALYVIGSLFIIAMLMNQLVEHLVLMFKEEEDEMYFSARSSAGSSARSGAKRRTSVTGGEPRKHESATATS